MRYPAHLHLAVASPELRLADVDFNVAQLLALMDQAAQQGIDLLLTPALSLTGAHCGDLFRHMDLLHQAQAGLERLRQASMAYPFLCLVVGLPRLLSGQLHSLAVALRGGEILHETCLSAPPPFAPLTTATPAVDAFDLLLPTPFSSARSEARDWAYPSCYAHPSGYLPLAVAILPHEGVVLESTQASPLVCLHPSAQPSLPGHLEQIKTRLALQSQQEASLHLYVAPSLWEAGSDHLCRGTQVMASGGRILHASEQKGLRPRPLATALVSLAPLFHQRRQRCEQPAGQHFHFFPASWDSPCERDPDLPLPSQGRYPRPAEAPFLPTGSQADQVAYFEDVLNLQALGLCRRLQHLGTGRILLGLSGGLDSTLALLAADRAIQMLEGNASDLIAVTLPGFGTSQQTYQNSLALAQALHADLREISIVPAVSQHFADIGHDPHCHDLTYENAQARERTQILMDVAGKEGALMLATGDLSELALGWCTYNGDHMGMYAVNSSLPKTLLRVLVAHLAQEAHRAGRLPLAQALDRVLETPISPELLPPDAEGRIRQKTEESTGPYRLHDFFLYHFLVEGAEVSALRYLATQAFAGPEGYSTATLDHWLRVFLTRFFSQQYKRACMPEGVALGPLSLSPRGAWAMPSDMTVSLWLKALEGWT